mmetsp:Transcript_20440/g.44278  ORF Transcript_20440/g.44278 Transcript_20440/m.44278 type:complete len:82 (+) Transcript_20440:44-289(+)
MIFRTFGLSVESRNPGFSNSVALILEDDYVVPIEADDMNPLSIRTSISTHPFLILSRFRRPRTLLSDKNIVLQGANSSLPF